MHNFLVIHAFTKKQCFAFGFTCSGSFLKHTFSTLLLINSTELTLILGSPISVSISSWDDKNLIWSFQELCENLPHIELDVNFLWKVSASFLITLVFVKAKSPVNLWWLSFTSLMYISLSASVTTRRGHPWLRIWKRNNQHECYGIREMWSRLSFRLLSKLKYGRKLWSAENVMMLKYHSVIL